MKPINKFINAHVFVNCGFVCFNGWLFLVYIKYIRLLHIIYYVCKVIMSSDQEILMSNVIGFIHVSWHFRYFCRGVVILMKMSIIQVIHEIMLILSKNICFLYYSCKFKKIHSYKTENIRCCIHVQTCQIFMDFYNTGIPLNLFYPEYDTRWFSFKREKCLICLIYVDV